MSLRRLAVAAALALGVALALSFRLAHPVFHTDEITYVSSALDSMILESVWPVKANGALFVNKPPLSLWLIRAAFELLGPSPFAARLPSVLAAAATAAVLYLLGAWVFGEAAGVLAAPVFAFTPGLAVLHGIRNATPDSLEVLLVAIAITGLEVWRRRRRPWALAVLVAAVALGAWVKSPFALIVVLAYLLVTELPARRAGKGTPRLIVTLLLVLCAWGAAYGLWLAQLRSETSPRAVKRLLTQQYVRRVQGRLGKDHVAGPGFYLASVGRDFGPLLLLPAGAALLAFRRRREPDPDGAPEAARLSGHDIACVAAWALAAPLLATLSVNKLPWYAYLSYPGLALLVSVGAVQLARAVSGRPSVRVSLLAAVVLVVAWRLPAGELWPPAARHRGVAARLWEVALRDPRLEVVPGARFRYPSCEGVDACREARFFVRALLWERRAAGTGACRATLVNRPREAAGLGDLLELHPPVAGEVGLYAADSCEGWLRGQFSPG